MSEPKVQADRISGRGLDDPGLQNEVVDRLYGTAMDPASFAELVDPWQDLMSPHWRAPAAVRGAALEGSGLLRHIHRVEQLIARMRDDADLRPEDRALLPYRRSAAFTLDARMRISGANSAARRGLGLHPGKALSTLMIRREDLSVLTRAARSMLRSRDGEITNTSRLIRARRLSDDSIVLLQARRIDQDGQPDFVLVVTTELRRPDGAAEILRSAFGLSSAEADVLLALTESRTLNDIAALRGRSVATIRTQIKAIHAKTETQGRNDLLRLAMTAMEFADPEDHTAENQQMSAAPPRMARGGLELPELAFRTLIRPRGRRLEYLEFGDPEGRPVIYFCSNFGLCRWPAAAEFAAAQTGLRIIVPVRPGMGGSDPLDPGTDRVEEVAQDTIALMNRLGIGSAQFLVLDEDLIFLSRIHACAPGRILAVLGTSMMLPLSRPEQYERMGRWHRFALGTARYTPQLFPFAVRAGFAFARHIGKAEFVRLVYATSAYDCAMTRNLRVFEAVDCGSDIVLGKTGDASRAYAEEVAMAHRIDWRPEYEAMSRAIPVVNLVGSEDQSITMETMAEFAREFPDTVLERVERTGSFLLFQQWPLVLRRLEAMMSDADMSRRHGN